MPLQKQEKFSSFEPFEGVWEIESINQNFRTKQAWITLYLYRKNDPERTFVKNHPTPIVIQADFFDAIFSPQANLSRGEKFAAIDDFIMGYEEFGEERGAGYFSDAVKIDEIKP